MAQLLQQDWHVLREGSEDLERFVLAQDLYWPLTRSVGGPHALTQFSLGTLALSARRLSAVRWPPEQQAELDRLLAGIASVQKQWQVNWARKAGHEYSARLRLWQDALVEMLSDQLGGIGGYASNARWRAMLHLLEHQSGAQPQAVELEALAMLDSRLRAVTRPGPFLWEPEVETAFPANPFWYLYVTFPGRA